MVTEIPTLSTDRLVLRPFSPADAPDVQRLAGAREVADTTLGIPHPYPDGAAEGWIATHRESAASGTFYTFAIARKEDGALVGAIRLTVNQTHNKAELGYWIGVPFWRNGYATEAACKAVEFGFEMVGLNRVFARCFTRNPASARVMQKGRDAVRGNRQAGRNEVGRLRGPRDVCDCALGQHRGQCCRPVMHGIPAV